jgi:hypothetical protein
MKQRGMITMVLQTKRTMGNRISEPDKAAARYRSQPATRITSIMKLRMKYDRYGRNEISPVEVFFLLIESPFVESGTGCQGAVPYYVVNSKSLCF